jgi:aspartyl/asparaginyl beta-hydroxylase (cupin superfamily)
MTTPTLSSFNGKVLKKQPCGPGDEPAGGPGMHSTVRDEALPPRFVKYIGQLRTMNERTRMNIYPDLTAQPWHDPQKFAVARDLEENAPEIIAEAKAIDSRLFQDEPENIGRAGRWSVFFLYERGRKNQENCSLCPTATAVIEAHRTVTTMAGMIYFSCLDPNTRVAPHKGPTNIRLRCHFGIEIPDRCGIRVGDVTATWKLGSCIVFDDGFEHGSVELE